VTDTTVKVHVSSSATPPVRSARNDAAARLDATVSSFAIKGTNVCARAPSAGKTGEDKGVVTAEDAVALRRVGIAAVDAFTAALIWRPNLHSRRFCHTAAEKAKQRYTGRKQAATAHVKITMWQRQPDSCYDTNDSRQITVVFKNASTHH
jgi:hypothetical protein